MVQCNSYVLDEFNRLIHLKDLSEFHRNLSDSLPRRDSDTAKRDAIRLCHILDRYRYCPSFYFYRNLRKELANKYNLPNPKVTVSRIVVPCFSDPIVVILLSLTFIALMLISYQLSWNHAAFMNGYSSNKTNTPFNNYVMQAACYYTTYQECLPCNQNVVVYNNTYYINSFGECNRVKSVYCPMISVSGINAVTIATNQRVSSYIDSVNNTYIFYQMFGDIFDNTFWNTYQCNRTIQGEKVAHNVLWYTIWGIMGGLIVYLGVIVVFNLVIREIAYEETKEPLLI